MSAALQELRIILARHLPMRIRRRTHKSPRKPQTVVQPQVLARQRSSRRAATSGMISMVDLGLDGALPLMDAASFMVCPPANLGYSTTPTNVPPTPVNSSNESEASEASESSGEESIGNKGWKRGRATAEF